MPEHIIKRVRGFTPDLYLSVSFQTMIKFSVKRGSKIKCVLKNILDDQGNVKNSLNKKIICDVSQRDGRFYLPSDLISEMNITGVDYLEIILETLISSNNSETELYPGELVKTNSTIS